MDLMTKTLTALLWAAALVWVVIVVDKKIARSADTRGMLIVRALLYAVAFTPTAYHHAPNTIVAPLHLSTLCGHLFYHYEYTTEMAVYGVALPIAGGWALVTIVLLFRRLAPTATR
jgi:hypothetical protein